MSNRARSFEREIPCLLPKVVCVLERGISYVFVCVCVCEVVERVLEIAPLE